MILTVHKYQNSVFVPDRVIDNAASVLWCERYQEPGEFAVSMRATPELLSYFTDHTLMLTRPDSDRAMLPERMVLKTSSENGDTLEVTGRSAESIPHSRIIFQDITMNHFANGAAMLYYLMQENVAGYWFYHSDNKHRESGKYRFIPFFNVGNVTVLPDETEVKAQPFGENLGDFTETICKACDIGFRVRTEKSDRNLYYEFYRGTDRSKAVIFSKDFQNLGDTKYQFNRRTYFNSVTVAGDGAGKDRARQTQTLHNSALASGFTLREKFIDAHNISHNTVDENGQPITEVMYNILLAKMAIAELYASKEEITFDGEILPFGQFRYRQDYFLGDTVSVRNDYGIRGTATVTEVTEYEDAAGVKVVPKFSEWVV